MATKLQGERAKFLALKARTAADLMVPNPVSIRANAAVQEAVALLTDKGFSAAPVIDEAGRPVGVLSRADIVTCDREKSSYVAPVPDYYQETAAAAEAGSIPRTGFQVVDVDRTRVRDIMTPVVFSVAPTTSAAKTVHEMLALKVHRLFVVDEASVLVGVISALDVLRHLE
jgi:CBS domain-containing protein